MIHLQRSNPGCDGDFLPVCRWRPDCELILHGDGCPTCDFTLGFAPAEYSDRMPRRRTLTNSPILAR